MILTSGNKQNPLQAGSNTIGNVKITDGTNIVDVISTNGYKGLVSVNPGCVSSVNSSTTPLLADGIFTGSALNILNYGGIGILVYSDVASATDGLVVQYTFEDDPEEADWHDGEAYTIPADTTKFFTPPKQAKYMRVKYTNGGLDQTTFNLRTFLSGTPFKFSSHNINDNLNDDDDGELTVTVLKLRTAQDTYVSAASTASGNFKVSLEEYESDTNPIRNNLEGGGKVSVGTTAVEVTFTGTTKSIIITADKDNTGTLYVGKSNVASDGSNAMTFLEVGDSIVIDYDDSSNAVYVVGSAASQNFWKGALL